MKERDEEYANENVNEIHIPQKSDKYVFNAAVRQNRHERPSRHNEHRAMSVERGIKARQL